MNKFFFISVLFIDPHENSKKYNLEEESRCKIVERRKKYKNHGQSHNRKSDSELRATMRNDEK